MAYLPHQVAVNSALLFGILLFNPLLSAQTDDSASERPKVTAVRFWSQADTTRIAIEATGQFEFRSDSLHNPERLFFDVIGARPQIGPKGVNVIPVRDRFVRQIRVAQLDFHQHLILPVTGRLLVTHPGCRARTIGKPNGPRHLGFECNCRRFPKTRSYVSIDCKRWRRPSPGRTYGGRCRSCQIERLLSGRCHLRGDQGRRYDGTAAGSRGDCEET